MCDSNSALLSVNSRTVTSSCVLDAITALAEVCKSLTLVWIKVQVNHAGNEQVDVLAKARASLNQDQSTHIRKPASLLKIICDKVKE